MASDENSFNGEIGITDNLLEKYAIPSPVSSHFGSSVHSPGRDWRLGGLSPFNDDAGKLKLEINQLRNQVRQLQMELQTEQDAVSMLRKKYNAVENEKLETTTKNNSELSGLETHIAKFRSQLERSEATRQSLEFELAKSKRDLTQHRHLIAQKDLELTDVQDELNQRICELTITTEDLEKHMQASDKARIEAENMLNKKLREKDDEMCMCLTEQEKLSSEWDKFNALVIQQEGIIAEMDQKIRNLELEKQSNTDCLRKNETELEYGKEKEDRLKRDLEAALQRLRTLEAGIEAERAAHMETKFNTEIVQLRLQDMQGTVEVEKAGSDEANKAIDRLSKQIRELEETYESERRNGKQLAEKLERVEKEYTVVRKQLTSEVESKKNVIGNLSKELEVHQKNFNALKNELNKAKKRQIYLQETYGGNMRELELLLQTFSIDERPTKNKGKKESVQSPRPTHVLEKLRLTLAEYKKKLDHSVEECSKMKKVSNSFSQEIDQCKEMIWNKDKALEVTQKNYTRTAKELNRVRAEYGELEGVISKLKVDIQSSSTIQSKDRTRIQELSEEILKLVKRHKSSEEEKLAFLHGLYQRLLAGRILVTMKEKGFNQFSWVDLTSLVFEQVSTLVTVSQRSEEKVNYLEDVVKQKESSIEDMVISHEEQLNKLTHLTKERELSWQKQKAEIEGHYSQIISEQQSRTKRTQVDADHAWQKVRTTGDFHQGLEAECEELRSQMADFKKQNASLISACSLLSGAVYPLCERASQLSIQRRLLEEHLHSWMPCRKQASILVETLSTEMACVKNKMGDKPNKLLNRKLLLRFRVGVLCVLAANRLQKLGQEGKDVIVCNTQILDHGNILISTGAPRHLPQSLSGQLQDIEPNDRDECDQNDSPILQWLLGAELKDTVTKATAGLMETIDLVKTKGKVGSIERRALLNAAKNSFTKLFTGLGANYGAAVEKSILPVREHNSLIRQLRDGLNRVLTDCTVEGKGNMTSPKDLMMALQCHILDFTQRLHSVEVERRSLLVEIGKLRQASRDSAPIDEVEKLQEEIKVLRIENQQSVPGNKFDSVCEELNNALHREQQAQQLLNEQGRQLEDLTMKLEFYSNQEMEKEQTFTETVKGLAENKLEMRRKEQMSRQLNKQIIQLEANKKSLQSNVKDAEKALRTVAKDKEILATYIKTIQGALEQVRKDISLSKTGVLSEVLSKVLLNPEFIPQDIGKAGPELIACQTLVGCFIDTQQQAVNKIQSLEGEIANLKHHVTRVKKELSDAVKREFEQQDLPDRNGFLTGKDMMDVVPSASDLDNTHKDSFYPLKEDSEISFCAPKPASPRNRNGSSKTNSKSPQFQTPSKSRQPSNGRPKNCEPGGM